MSSLRLTRMVPVVNSNVFLLGSGAAARSAPAISSDDVFTSACGLIWLRLVHDEATLQIRSDPVRSDLIQLCNGFWTLFTLILLLNTKRPPPGRTSRRKVFGHEGGGRKS